MRRAIIGFVASLTAFAVVGCTSASSSSGLEQAKGADGEPPTEAVTVQRVDFQVTYRLEGVTEDSAEVGLLPNPHLTLVPSVPLNSPVVAGQDIGTIEVDPRVRSQLDRDGAHSDLDQSRLAQLEAMTGIGVAPVDGLLAGPDDAPVIVADGVDVVVALTPIQHLRYRSLLFAGQSEVETVVGVRQVPCAAVWIENRVGDVGADGEVTSARLRCRLPRAVETVAGLRARLILSTEPIADALVVLNTYIGYDAAADGYFLIIREGGTERRVPVLVGATDGVRRVILSDVPAGAELVRPREESSG